MEEFTIESTGGDYYRNISRRRFCPGTGIYIRVDGVPDFSVDALRREVDAIVAADTLLRRRRIPTAEAIAYFASLGQTDKARLFAYREKATLDVYSDGDFMEYYHGELAPATG